MIVRKEHIVADSCWKSKISFFNSVSGNMDGASWGDYNLSSF